MTVRPFIAICLTLSTPALALQQEYLHDDGGTETAMGFTFGGEIAWLVLFDTATFAQPTDTIVAVGSAWGSTLLGPDFVPPDGTAVSLYVWEDTDDDGDPRTGLVLLQEIPTLITNVNTDIVNYVPTSSPVHVSRVFFVGASANHDASEYPAPGDQRPTLGRAWMTGSLDHDGFDPTDIDGPNSVGVFEMGDFAPMRWLTRAIGAGDGTPLKAYCSGDGTGTPCPCGNESSTAGAGCENSTGEGATLGSWGTLSVSADDLGLLAGDLVPGQPALLFCGTVAVGAGDGVWFGDGLRCAGGSVVRLGVRVPDALGGAAWGPGLGSVGGWGPGDLRRFQAWYRDPGGPCGSHFNLSNGLEGAFAP